MAKNKLAKWINMTAFGLLMLGGLNFLLMGLFKFDMYAGMFGGSHSVTSRVFYSIFGISALVLLAAILWKAYMGKKTVAVVDKPSAKTASKSA